MVRPRHFANLRARGLQVCSWHRVCLCRICCSVETASYCPSRIANKHASKILPFALANQLSRIHGAGTLDGRHSSDRRGRLFSVRSFYCSICFSRVIFFWFFLFIFFPSTILSLFVIALIVPGCPPCLSA